MTTLKKNQKICRKGHVFHKTSQCPVCPICEMQRKPKSDFLSLLAAPARRALENKGIKTIRQLSSFSESEVLQLHGMGPGSIPKLRQALKVAGLSFKR